MKINQQTGIQVGIKDGQTTKWLNVHSINRCPDGSIVAYGIDESRTPTKIPARNFAGARQARLPNKDASEVIYLEGGGWVEVYPDDVCENPRHDWDCWLGTLALFDKDGDLQPFCDKNVTWADGQTLRPDYHSVFNENGEYEDSEFDSWDSFMDALKQDGSAVVLPVYRYEHGSVSYRTTPFSCGWDSGQVGVVFVSAELLSKEGLTVEEATTCIGHEIETFSQWANGEVYYCKAFDANGDMIGSCGSLYGQCDIDGFVDEHGGYAK